MPDCDNLTAFRVKDFLNWNRTEKYLWYWLHRLFLVFRTLLKWQHSRDIKAVWFSQWFCTADLAFCILHSGFISPATNSEMRSATCCSKFWWFIQIYWSPQRCRRCRICEREWFPKRCYRYILPVWLNTRDNDWWSNGPLSCRTLSHCFDWLCCGRKGLKPFSQGNARICKIDVLGWRICCSWGRKCPFCINWDRQSTLAWRC